MANEIATDSQTLPTPSETLPSENVTPEETAAPRTVRFADREKARLAVEKVFRLHARLFEELAK